MANKTLTGIVIMLSDMGGGQNQYGMIRLFSEASSPSGWAWASVLGEPLGDGSRSGWVTLDRTSGPLVTHAFFRQNNGTGNKGFVALDLEVKGWPLTASSQGKGDHQGTSSTNRPSGRLQWRVTSSW